MSWFSKLVGNDGDSAAAGDARGSGAAGEGETPFGFAVAVKDPDEAYLNAAIAQMLHDKVEIPVPILLAMSSGTLTISQSWKEEEGRTYVWLHAR